MQANKCLKFDDEVLQTESNAVWLSNFKKVADSSCQFTSRKIFFSFLGKVNNRDPTNSGVALNVLHIEQLNFFVT